MEYIFLISLLEFINVKCHWCEKQAQYFERDGKATCTHCHFTMKRKGIYTVDPLSHICKCGNRIVKYHAKQCLECYLKSVKKTRTQCTNCGQFIKKYNKTKMCKKCWRLFFGGDKSPKPVIQYDLQGNIVTKWKSLYHIGITTEMMVSAIQRCLKGKQKTSYGFIWKYL